MRAYAKGALRYLCKCFMGFSNQTLAHRAKHFCVFPSQRRGSVRGPDTSANPLQRNQSDPVVATRLPTCTTGTARPLVLAC